MSTTWAPTQADVEQALGGAKTLLQLCDPNRTGTIDEAMLASYITYGVAKVRGAVQVKHEPEALDSLSPDDSSYLTSMAAVISAQRAWVFGGGGEAMPPILEKLYDEALADLDKIALGRYRIGRSSGGTAPALSQPVGVVDYDPNCTGISIANFRRGFR